MQPADKNANPHFYPQAQITVQNPAPATWLGRVVVRVRERLGGVAPAHTLGVQAHGVPFELRGDVITQSTPLDANAPRFRTLGIEFRTLESAQRYNAIVGDSGGIGRVGRRGAITAAE